MAGQRQPQRRKQPSVVESIEQTVSAMANNHLLCRDLGHAWQPFTADRVGRAFESTLRCSRCRSTKSRMITSEGFLNGSKFNYSDGYLVKGFGRATVQVRSVMRLQSVLRVIK